MIPTIQDAYKLVHAGTLALSRAESQGIRVDLEYCERTKKELTERINSLESQFMATNFYRAWAHRSKNKININSGAQLEYYLYKVKGIEIKKFTETGRGATDEEALLEHNIPELNQLVEIRKLRKARDTYLDAFIREQVNGVIHPFFHLHSVKSHRSSSDKPNFQNLPKRDPEIHDLVRKALYPRKGHHLMAFDYGSLEVRIAACFHKDPTMLKYIKDPTTDMHADMAEQIYKYSPFDKSAPELKYLRSATKNGFVFPEFYGDYYVNCAEALACKWGELPPDKWKKNQGVMLPGNIHLGEHLIAQGIPSLKAFEKHIQKIEEDFWGNRFKVYAQWKEKWWRDYRKKGYFDTLTGFRCKGQMFRNDVINYPVQGSAFHCLLWSFIKLDELIQKENLKTRLIGQIHDEVIFDVHPDETQYIIDNTIKITTVDLPKHWPWIIVPLEVEGSLYGVDESWATTPKHIQHG